MRTCQERVLFKFHTKLVNSSYHCLKIILLQLAELLLLKGLESCLLLLRV